VVNLSKYPLEKNIVKLLEWGLNFPNKNSDGNKHYN
jgi:hypothetical protein